jgi:hypothetical protein
MSFEEGDFFVPGHTENPILNYVSNDELQRAGSHRAPVILFLCCSQHRFCQAMPRSHTTITDMLRKSGHRHRRTRCR